MPGEVIIIFCTGLGEVTPQVGTGFPATGLHTTVETPTVTIDGILATVQFSGLAPGFVGLYQLNVTVPAGTRQADDVPVVLTIGGKDSNLGKTVTIAVQEEGGGPTGGGGGTTPPVNGGTEDDFLDDDDPPDDDDGYC